MLKKRTSIESYDDVCIGDKLTMHFPIPGYDKKIIVVTDKIPFNSSVIRRDGVVVYGMGMYLLRGSFNYGEDKSYSGLNLNLIDSFVRDGMYSESKINDIEPYIPKYKRYFM